MHDNTKLARRLSAVLVAGLLLVGLSACSSDDSDSSSDTTAAADSGGGSTDTTAADSGGGGGEGETAPVISDFAFSPDPLQVAVGDTVTWTNDDDFAHTVTSDDDDFDSGNIDGGDTFEQTFDEAGEFTYHCAIHSQMTGTVNVT